MGFRERLEAKEAELRSRAERQEAGRHEYEETKAEHANLAEALIPEADDAIAMLRSAQDASVAALKEQRNRDIELCWQGQGRKRRFIGWKVFTSRASGPGQIGEWSPGLVCVFIPVNGELQVESSAPSATGPLREYLRGGCWHWEDKDGFPSIAREEKADETLESLFGLLASHLAVVNLKQGCM